MYTSQSLPKTFQLTVQQVRELLMKPEENLGMTDQELGLRLGILDLNNFAETVLYEQAAAAYGHQFSSIEEEELKKLVAVTSHSC